MANMTFTYQIEDFQQKYSYSPFLSIPSGVSEHFSYQPLFNPLKIKKTKVIKEQSREERMHLEKCRVVERFRQRFTNSQLPGSEYGISYIEHKNRQGLKANTIRTSGSVALSFLDFIHSNGRSLEAVSKADLEAWVENDQDKGVSIVSVFTKLRGLYPFLSFLVDKHVIDPGILAHRIKIIM